MFAIFKKQPQQLVTETAVVNQDSLVENWRDTLELIYDLAPEPTEQPKIKLTYRGNTFDYTPRPVVVSDEVETNGPTVTLTYRGNTFERKLQTPKPYKNEVETDGRTVTLTYRGNTFERKLQTPKP